MLPAIRRARIIELLRRDGAAELKEMSSALSVSVSTLRRDVDYLCEQGHVERTHGGALLTEGRRAGIELEREIASELESDAKRTIGARAAELIAGGQTVILDSGTTTASAARAARDRRVPFKIRSQGKRHAMFCRVEGIFGDIEGDVHAGYCIKRVQDVDKPKAIPTPKKILSKLENITR